MKSTVKKGIEGNKKRPMQRFTISPIKITNAEGPPLGVRLPIAKWKTKTGASPRSREERKKTILTVKQEYKKPAKRRKHYKGN